MILSIVAIVMSFFAAAFTGWYAWETRKMRRDNKTFADQQIAQSKSSFEAAQRSASIAEQQLAQGKIASEAADRSAKAAEMSAKAAEDTVKTAIQSTQLSQRAYLGTTGIEFLSNIPNANQALVVKVILKNLGNSPALNVRLAYKIHFQEDVQTVRPLYPDNKAPGFDIAPGVEIPLEHILPGNVTAQNMNDLASDSKRLYAFGWARYKNIFGKEHWTKWCYEYSRFTPGSIFKIVHTYHKIEDIE